MEPERDGYCGPFDAELQKRQKVKALLCSIHSRLDNHLMMMLRGQFAFSLLDLTHRCSSTLEVAAVRVRTAGSRSETSSVLDAYGATLYQDTHPFSP